VTDAVLAGRYAAADFDEMGQRWLGLGNLEGRYWFCGLEPGGTELPEWPSIWATRYHGAEVIDTRGEAGDPDHGKWFGPNAGLQPTWQGLIRTLLAFEGRPVDDAAVVAHQRQDFIRGDGDEAILELSAYAARSLDVDVPREKYMPQRIERIAELLRVHKPTFLVCYGRSRRRDFERLCGGPFDGDGFRWSGSTLCALTIHPTPRFRPAPKPEHWIGLGRELRRRVVGEQPTST
jgi:hypothetical protein